MQLELKGVGKRYPGGIQALEDFSITLGPGVHGLLGPNGAGKSTLMRMLATVSRPSAGTITWNGTDVVRAPNALRRRLGYLPQDFGVYPNLSAAEFLEYLAAAKGVGARTAKARIDALLEMTHLTAVRRRPLGGFSGGMRQRVGICQALLNDPQLLIVDEPTAGLDPEERVRFSNILSELSADRVVLLSTHIVSDVEAVAETLAVIDHGRLLAHRSPDAMVQAVGGRVWQWAIPADRLDRLDPAWSVVSRQRRGDAVRMRLLADSAPGSEAVPAEPTLLDAYVALLADGRSATARSR